MAYLELLPQIGEAQAEAIQAIRVKDASIADLSLDFTLPGYPQMELKPDGAAIDVTIDNVQEYIRLVVEYTLIKGTQRYAQCPKYVLSS